MNKKEKIELIEKEIKKLKSKLETTDNILSINAKILRYTIIKNKLEEED